MKFIIFAILLTGTCISALPQVKPIANVDFWATLKGNILKPLEVLRDSLQTYLDEITQTPETTPTICEDLQKVIRAQSHVVQQLFKTLEDWGVGGSLIQIIKQEISKFEKILLDKLKKNCVLTTADALDKLYEMLKLINQAIENLNSGESKLKAIQLITDTVKDIILFWTNEINQTEFYSLVAVSNTGLQFVDSVGQILSIFS